MKRMVFLKAMTIALFVFALFTASSWANDYVVYVAFFGQNSQGGTRSEGPRQNLVVLENITSAESMTVRSDTTLEVMDYIRELFPKTLGIITLSRVGFSADRRQALLYCEHQRGKFVDVGEVILFERAEGRWRFTRRMVLWTS